MKIKALLFAATLAVGVAGPAASASADIFVFFPPNPSAPSDETDPLVTNLTAPADVEVFWFERNPGPPNVTVDPTPTR